MTRVNWMTICSRSVPSGVVLSIFSIAACARATMNCVCSATVSSRNCLNSFICGELEFFLNSARVGRNLRLVQPGGQMHVLLAHEFEQSRKGLLERQPLAGRKPDEMTDA